MDLKQIFCFHIDKEQSRDLLYWTREVDGGGDGYIITYSNFAYYSCNDECVKCKRKKTVKRQLNLGRGQLPLNYYRSQ